MTLNIETIARWATAFVAILSFAKLVVAPFKRVMDENKLTMRSLQETIRDLSRDLKDSQEDRKNIHKILERHDSRISKVENDTVKIATICEGMRKE